MDLTIVYPNPYCLRGKRYINVQRRGGRHLAGQLHALRPRLYPSVGENFAAHQKPLRAKPLNHVK